MRAENRRLEEEVTALNYSVGRGGGGRKRAWPPATQ